MKQLVKHLFFLTVLLLLSCGGKEEKPKDGFNVERQKTEVDKTEKAPVESAVKASERVDLSNKGVGPVTSLTLEPQVDQALASEGETVYNQMCLACHRIGKKFIGPPPNNVLERRTPEWVMNMILNPEVMVKEDPLAKDLLVEFNGSPMANQGLNEDQARAILEYFRTLK